MTGEVISRVPHPSKAEVRAAVENALATQPAWATTNLQRRARVLTKFLELVARDMDPLPELLAREHGKTITDAKGDIQRGIEVIEFAIGIPHLMKGEFTNSPGPGIDIYSMHPPLGVLAGITPFNFPAMIPTWKFGPAIACGNAFVLVTAEVTNGKPSDNLTMPGGWVITGASSHHWSARGRQSTALAALMESSPFTGPRVTLEQKKYRVASPSRAFSRCVAIS
jgi:aldehyde dehydrogenase family protein